VDKIQTDDNKTIENLEQKIALDEQTANFTHQSVLSAIEQAENRILMQIVREKADMEARISSAKTEGETARRDLEGQLNATLATTENMLLAYDVDSVKTASQTQTLSTRSPPTPLARPTVTTSSASAAAAGSHAHANAAALLASAMSVSHSTEKVRLLTAREHSFENKKVCA